MSTRVLNPEPVQTQRTRPPASKPELTRAGVTEMVVDYESASWESVPELDLSELDVPARTARILDDDAARALVTHWLLHELAPMLGIDPAKLEIHIDADAESRNNARQATGLVEDGAIYLHPQRFDPLSKQGRSLLAHETAHTAQRLIAAPAVQHAERAHAAAEYEASAIARAFAERSPVTRPVATLPLQVVAAAEDAPDLSATVPISRAREIAEIHSTLSGLWISDGDVFKVMRILDTMPFPVGQEVVFLLGHDDRYALADNINSPHLGPHTTSVIATYSALTKDELVDAIDLDVFGEGTWGDMTSEVKMAARDVITKLTEKQKQKLLKSDNRLDIKRITSGADVFPEEEKERKATLEKIQQKEADLAKARQEIESMAQNPDANALLKQVREVLQGSSQEEDTSQSQRAVAALELLTPYQKTVVLQYVAEKLDSDGLVDVVIDALPDTYFFDSGPHTETLLDLVQARLPSKNIDLVVNLLSYGLFDWAIRDYEAKFAYRILLALPLADQYRFRQRENGKYFMRLVENLPEEVTKQKGYHEIEVHKASKDDLEKIKKEFKPDQKNTIDEEAGLYDAGQLYANKRGANQELVVQLEEQFSKARKGGWKEDDAEKLHQALAAVGGATIGEKGKFTAKDQLLTEAAVHDLDSLGYIDELFDALNTNFLFSETNRITTVKIMMARDPARAAAHARDLVSYGFLDWMVSAREAYLAYLIVKALPDDERKSFIKNDGWAWNRIQGEMSEDMRQSRDLNMYVGDKEGQDRASVLGQLADESTWTEENAVKLDGLLRMAIAMTEHKFAFERSKQFKAYEDGKPQLNALVKKYKLAENAQQEWQPDILKGTKWYEEGLFDTIRTIWKGLVLLFDSNILLLSHSVGVDVDLNKYQNFEGGDISGAHLADPKKPKDPNQPPNPDANKLSVRLDPGAHALSVIMPDLIIDSLNFQGADTNFEAGSIRLKDLRIHVTYDSEDMYQPTVAQIDVGSLQIDDLLMAMREKMVTASRFLLNVLHLGAGTKDTTTTSKTVPRGGWFPIPVFGLLVTGVYNLFKFKGWGPDTPAQDMKRSAEQVRALDLTFGHLEVQGLSTSGGQTIGNIKVVDFALHVGLNKTTLLRAKIASLDNQIKQKRAQKDDKAADALEAQKQQASTDLEKLKADEDWLIAAQQRIIHEKLSAEEQKKLQDRIDKLKFEAEAGMFLDVGSIDVTGVSGGVTVKSPIHLEGLHGEGKAGDAAAGFGLGLVTDAKLISQLTEGSKAPGPMSEQDGGFRLNIDKLSAEGVSIGGGQIRSSSEIQDKMTELEKDKEKPEFAGLYEELQNLLPQAVRYEQYVQIGISALDKTQLADYQNLRTVLAKDPSIVFGSIELLRAHLDVDLKTSGVGLGVDQATLKNISMPEKGLSFDEVKGTDIKANASVDQGLAGWLDWKKHLSGGGLSAGTLEVSGARSRTSGLLFEKATLKGGEAAVKERGNVATAGFQQLTVEGLGLEPRLNLMKRRLAAMEQNHKPSAKEKKERDKLRQDVPALEALADKRTLAVNVRNKAKTAEERKAADQALQDVDDLIAASLAEYGSARLQLDEFGIKATGAGDVLGDVLDGGFSTSKILKRGVTIEGTGPDHQVLKGGTFGYQRPAPDDEKVGDPTEVKLGPVKLNATVSQDEKTNEITVGITQLDLASLSLSEMMLTGLDETKGGAKIWSSGRSVVNDVKFAGRMVFTPVGNPDGDYRLSFIKIDKLDIAEIEARGLGYLNSELKVEVRANSGLVKGVHAADMSIDIPADPKADAVILGKAKIESISNADISAALPGGMELTHGVLNAKQLGIEFLEGGGKTLSTDDLSLTAAELRGPDGWARFSLEHLSGGITIDKNGYKLKNVRLQKLTVPSLDWRAGETGRITADQPVELGGLSVDGRIDTKEVDVPVKKGEKPKPGATPKKQTKLVGVHINNLKVDSITAKHLTYKDGDTVIDVGVPNLADKDIPKFMTKFRPFYIENFTITGLDWTRDVGISRGEINVEKYGAALVYQDLGTHLKTGGGLTGAGMHASFTGPNTGTATVGKLEKIAGFFKNKDISTRVGALSIMASFTFGDKFVEMNNLVVDNVYTGKTNYGEGTDSALGFKSGYIDKVTVDKIHVDYDKTSKDGQEKTELKGVKIGEVKFDNVRAYDLTYDGKSTEKVEGQDVNKTKHLEARTAFIERLRFVDINYDPETAMAKFGIRVEEDPDKKKYPGLKPEAFGVSGVVGQFVSKFSDGTDTVAKLAASLSGGPISGDNITLQKITDSTSGKSRIVPSGTFSLSRLGLTGITGSYKDRKGTTTTLENKYGEQASIEFEGVNPTLDADGTLRIGNINAQAKNFEITRGKMSVSIPLLDIKNLALGMRGLGTEQGIHGFGLKIGELSEKNMAIYIVRHSHKQTKEEADAAMKDPVDRFFAEPLSTIDGDIHLNIPDIPGDPGENFAITYGSLYFINAHPVNLGMDEKGLYLAARSGGEEHGRIHIHKMKPLPGLMPDFMTSGGLNIKELVEGLINEPPTPYDPNAEEPEEHSSYNWAKIRTGPGGLSLGTGRLGVSLSGAKEPGPDDFYLELENGEAGRNIIHIPESTLGEDIRVNIPKLHAKQIVFPGGKTGSADFNVFVDVRGLATLDMNIMIGAPSGTIKDIEFGDLSVLPEDTAPAPAAKGKGAGTP
jgi:hypothetical protein